MSDLAVVITTLEGTPLVQVQEFTDLEVVVPLNDSRTAKFNVSINDTHALGALGANAEVMFRAVQIFYRGKIIFWGYVMKPVWDTSNGTVEVNCHDPTLKLKRHYVRYGDFVVGNNLRGGYPVNGLGARLIVSSTYTTPRQRGLGFRELPMLFGIDTTSNLAQTAGPYKGNPRPIDLSDPAVDKYGEPDSSHKNYQGSADAYWRVLERGTEVWEGLTNLMESVEGFDIEWEPVHKTYVTNLNFAGTYQTKNVPAGFYVQMNTRVKQGYNRAHDNRTAHPWGVQNVVWEAGYGRQNVEKLTYEPDGNEMRNYATVTYPAGERSPVDKKRYSSRYVLASAQKYGSFHAWESAGERDEARNLRAKADNILTGFAYPPEFITIEPVEDQAGGGLQVPYRPFHDYGVGDEITVRVRDGALRRQFRARVMAVTLSQEATTKRTRSSLDVVPRVLETMASAGFGA